MDACPAQRAKRLLFFINIVEDIYTQAKKTIISYVVVMHPLFSFNIICCCFTLHYIIIFNGTAYDEQFIFIYIPSDLVIIRTFDYLVLFLSLARFVWGHRQQQKKNSRGVACAFAQPSDLILLYLFYASICLSGK